MATSVDRMILAGDVALGRSELPDTVTAVVVQLAIGVALAVFGAVLANWLYARFFRARRDVAAENNAIQSQYRADAKIPAAVVSLVRTPPTWVGWFSDDLIEISADSDPGLYNTRFPGNDRATSGSTPHRTSGARLVESTFVFDLTGAHKEATRVASIRAVIDERRPVFAQTVYFAVPQGITEKHALAFDLGSPDLNARMQDADGAPISDHFVHEHTATLVRGESVGFVAVVFAPLFGDAICYHLEIAFDSGPPVLVYDQGGVPFRIVGYPRTARRAYFAASTDFEDWPNYPEDAPYRYLSHD